MGFPSWDEFCEKVLGIYHDHTYHAQMLAWARTERALLILVGEAVDKQVDEMYPMGYISQLPSIEDGIPKHVALELNKLRDYPDFQRKAWNEIRTVTDVNSTSTDARAQYMNAMRTVKKFLGYAKGEAVEPDVPQIEEEAPAPAPMPIVEVPASAPVTVRPVKVTQPGSSAPPPIVVPEKSAPTPSASAKPERVSVTVSTPMVSHRYSCSLPVMTTFPIIRLGCLSQYIAQNTPSPVGFLRVSCC